MTFAIDRGSPTPVFNQIYVQFEGLIRSGLMEAGAPLPSIRQLAQSLDVSANSVKHAYEDLEANGLIVTSPGRTARVAERSRLSCDVLAAIQCLVVAAHKHNADLAATQNVLSAVWEMEPEE
ncbi:GntR family transcriptional regulator [Bifidobacterium catulorum]|nr:winged helix-turn-helix domain-containing protein [Bifidobacterium catulorum]